LSNAIKGDDDDDDGNNHGLVPAVATRLMKSWLKEFYRRK
jgi:hypothetical protein